MKELRIPTKRTDPIHNDTSENTTFLLLDQLSGEASATGTLITSKNEIAINTNTVDWKAIVMVVISPNRLNRFFFFSKITFISSVQ
jgi:hypothetical protein